MSNQFEQTLQKNYEDLIVNGKSGCFFINVDDENQFRVAVDDFCILKNLHDVIKIQMTPSNLTEPLSLLVELIRRIAKTYFKDDYIKYFIKFKSDHPESSNIVELFLNGEVQKLEFPLYDEIHYLQNLYLKTFSRIFLELIKGNNSPIIFISGFQYASYSFLDFFSNFIKQDHQDHSFLIISSFCSEERPKLKHDKNLWTKWIWDLECSGKLLHYAMEGNYADRTSRWPVIAEDSELGINVIATMNKAEELINQVCFNEALQMLQKIFEVVTESYDPQTRIRLNLLMGRAQLFSGYYEEALVSFDRLNDIAQKIKDDASLCLSNLELAYTHVFRGDYRTAQRYVAYAMKYAQGMDGLLPVQVQFCEFVVTDFAALPFPLEHMQKLLIDLQMKNMCRERVYVLNKIFSQEPFYPDVFTPEICLNFVNEAIDLARTHHLQLFLASAYHGKGVIYVKAGQIDKAITCFLESEDIRVALNIPSELARIKNGIGYLYCLKENFENSHAYYIDAMRTVIALNDLSEISSTLFNLAWLYFQIGECQGVLSVLNTLGEILKVKNTKYFPFRNLHDVFLLQGFAYFAQGMFVHTGQMIDNSLNLDIEISFQGKLLRPLLRALLATVHREREKAFRFLKDAEDIWEETNSQLSSLHHVLYMRSRIFIYRCWDELENAYYELKKATKFCHEHNYFKALDVMNRAWIKQNSLNVEDVKFTIPKVELKQILFIIRQERNVNNLHKQVYGMRLCSLLQQLTTSSDDLEYLASETLRLLCMHYNVQGGLVYVHKSLRKNRNKRNINVLATYNQLHNFLLSYNKFEQFIIDNENKNELVYRKVDIEDQKFTTVILLPLFESKNIFGHIVLTTNLGDFDVDDYQLDALRFVANILASKIITVEQREQLIKLSTRDQLTGLRNRQYFQERLAKVRHQSNCCLAFIDLDNFKHYNDTFGHDVGDKLLVWFADLLTEIETKKIKVCRWGGDEFLVLFNETTLAEAEQVMKTLKARLVGKNGFVKELTIFLNHSIMLPRSLYLDFSAGICGAENMEESIDPARLLKMADDRLYNVKRSGKARIVCCDYNESETE